MVTIDLPKEAEAALATFAMQDGHSREDLAMEAVLEYLSERQAVAVAEERLRELELGQSSTVPLAEVMKRYGMER